MNAGFYTNKGNPRAILGGDNGNGMVGQTKGIHDDKFS
jgi:hypothetical protein